jgi:quinolinate synthase
MLGDVLSLSLLLRVLNPFLLLKFLDPDPDAVAALRDGLLETNMGIVAHFYMDVELQGILQALKHSHPDLEHRVCISDSLKMGDEAVNMVANHGVESVVCLGVDFMSESVQAILGKNGFGSTPVYRATEKAIGCSLAESAEGDLYKGWLQKMSTNTQQPSLHVIYINTSLETKAISSSIVPTITCTSSNVLATLLQAGAQIPNVQILYGPDTYMGHNLQSLLDALLANPKEWTDEKIQANLHPAHTRASIQELRNNLQVFPQGTCVVHHMFGQEVVKTVRENYLEDCYVTAHLEVPGEMFELAMEKSLKDEGVVGSTSDILNFITRKVQDAAAAGPSSSGGMRRLKFVLGTEAGMVTSIVKSVQDILHKTNGQVEAEIIFPVSSEAVMSTEGDDTMAVVPGAAGGEGCSAAGGCATCPFMKMNDLDALQDIIDMVKATDTYRLTKHLPSTRLKGKQINGVDAVELGTEAIVYMRQFMIDKELPIELEAKVLSNDELDEKLLSAE